MLTWLCQPCKLPAKLHIMELELLVLDLPCFPPLLSINFNRLVGYRGSRVNLPCSPTHIDIIFNTSGSTVLLSQQIRCVDDVTLSWNACLFKYHLSHHSITLFLAPSSNISLPPLVSSCAVLGGNTSPRAKIGPCTSISICPLLLLPRQAVPPGEGGGRFKYWPELCTLPHLWRHPHPCQHPL